MMVYAAIPEPPTSSVPDQLTENWPAGTCGGSAETLLDGAPLSMVLSHSFVVMGGFVSKVIVALLMICVPVRSPDAANTLKATCPSPLPVLGSFGGRNPAVASAGKSFVIGSI